MNKIKLNHMPKALGFVAVILLLMFGCSKDNIQPVAKTNHLKATNYYQAWTAGGGSMNAQNLGNGHYTVSWSNVQDIVVGTGYNPCNNATMSWTGYANGALVFMVGCQVRLQNITLVVEVDPTMGHIVPVKVIIP